MYRKLVFVLGLFTLLSSSIYARFYLVEVKALNGYPVHNVDTGLDYATIQEAINADETKQGHTIFVQEGMYYENVVLTKPNLTLIGENKRTTVIDGNRKSIVVSLKANNTKIKGFTVQNGSCGIQIYPWTSGHIICNNVISNNDYGVSGHYDCVNISICDNIISSNNAAGIEMLFSHSMVCNNLISDNGKGEFQGFGSGVHIVRGTNSKIVYCVNNTIFGNTIKNHKIGIWAIRYSEENLFFHNNFVNNTEQISATATTWNNSAMENYWSDYDGIDANNDGIGDTPYRIGDIVQDEHPLMGVFYDFDTSLSCYVNVVSNSTIEDFEYFKSNSTIKMHVSNRTINQTYGFCRVCIPYALMNETYHVTIDGAEPYYVNYTLYDNGTHRWIYFSYKHSTLQIVMVPEFLSSIILPLFMIVTLLAVIAYRKNTLHNRMQT